MNDETDIVQRQTVEGMVIAYQTASTQIEAAWETITTALADMEAAFGSRIWYDLEFPKSLHNGEFAGRLKRVVWLSIADRMEVRRLMSSRRAKEFDAELHTGTLPEITVDNIIATTAGWAGQTRDFMGEALVEAFNILRPQTHHKSNNSFTIGPKIVLTGMVRERLGGWSVSYGGWPENTLRVLDNVFSLLDGQGPIKDGCGPTYQAIYGAKEKPEGETAYFRLKWFQNGNLHMTFKRRDLVDKLLREAGRRTLNQPTQ